MLVSDKVFRFGLYWTYSQCDLCGSRFCYRFGKNKGKYSVCPRCNNSFYIVERIICANIEIPTIEEVYE